MLELTVVHDDFDECDISDYRIHNATIVPFINSTIDTPNGIRKVIGVHYDYSQLSGDCRVTILVTPVRKNE